MSYVRWSSPGHPHPYDSAVYIFDDVYGGITCCACVLQPTDSLDDFNVATHDEMIEHVREHIAAGHAVPDFVIARLVAAAAD